MGILHEDVRHFGIHFFSTFFASSMTSDNENKWEKTGISVIFAWGALCLSHPGGDLFPHKFVISWILLFAVYFYKFNNHRKMNFFSLTVGNQLRESGISISHILFDTLVHVDLGEKWQKSLVTSVIFFSLMALWEYGGCKKQCKFVYVGMSITCLICYYV